jgi:hypothetical protein
MNINKPTKIAIGVSTIFAVLFPFVIAPAFVMFFIFGSGFPFFDPQSIPNPYEIEKTMFPMMMVFYPVMMCFTLVQLGLQVFYIIHEIKNKVLTDTYRILFAIGTFFLPYIAMPIYFIAYLWKDNPQELKSSQAEITS